MVNLKNSGYSNFIFSKFFFERLIFVLFLLAFMLNFISFANATSIEKYKDYYIGSSGELDTKELGIALENIDLNLLEGDSNKVLRISKISRPIDRYLIGRISYEYFSIDDKLDSINDISLDLRFKVSSEWIDNFEGKEEAISLYFFERENEKWKELDTDFMYKKGDTYTFKSYTSSTGYFVIADKDYVIEEKKKNKDKDTNEQINNTNSSIKPDVEIPKNNDNNTSNVALTGGTSNTGKIYSSYLFYSILALFVSLLVILYIVFKKKSGNNYPINDVLNRAESRISTRIEANERKGGAESSIKQKIDALEPKIAFAIASKLKNQGYDNESIKTVLINRDIRKDIIEKVI